MLRSGGLQVDEPNSSLCIAGFLKIRMVIYLLCMLFIYAEGK